jgi:cytochrome P450
MSWCIKFISAHPDVQRRLRQALQEEHADAHRQKRAPTCDEITSASIPYLDAVLEETLRVAGTFPMLIRQAVRDTQILGHAIPKGTNILILTQGPSYVKPGFDISEMLRSPESRAMKASRGPWDPAHIHEFLPERWLKHTRHTRDDGSVVDRDVFDNNAGPSLPFGAGLRACFGRRLAMMELRMVVTLMVWYLQFDELPEGLNQMGSLARMTNQPEVCFVRPRRV